MNEREIKFSSFSIIFPFYLLWLFFFLFLHFRFPRCHSFFCSIPIKICSFIVSSFIKSSFCFYHVFLIRSFLSSFISLSCLIQFFQSFVFANFSLLFIWYIVPLWYRSLFCFTFTYSAFPFLKVVFSFCLYSILLKHAAIPKERFGQTCMTKEQSEMLMLTKHPFARPRPSLHWTVRCTYRP